MANVKKQKYEEDGFVAGLQFWVIFLVGFVLLGYPLALSIIFGAIAGIAGGSIVTWWQQAVTAAGKVIDINDADLINAYQSEDLVQEVKTKRREKYSAGRRRRDRDSKGRLIRNWAPWRKSRE
jgi:hypothetical protein